MKLPYGLGVAAALIAGGTAIYYAARPRSVITAPDIAELAEGVNERLAATGSWPFSGDTNEWSFSVFLSQSSGIPSVDYWDGFYGDVAMKSIMDQTLELADGKFVKEWSQTNVVLWTAPELFQHCQIGPADGTQTLYTVGVGTNGAPIYSNAPIATVWTGLVWEIYRLQAAMTTTSRLIGWNVGTDVAIDRFRETLQNSFIDSTWDMPAWYVAFTNDGSLDPVPDGTFQTNRGLPKVSYGSATVAAGGAYETVDMRGPQNYFVNIGSGVYSIYSAYDIYNFNAARKTNTVTIRLPNMAAGCEVSVDYRIPITGSLTLTNVGLSATNWSYAATNEFVSNIIFSGVATGWSHEVTLRPDATLDLIWPGWSNGVACTDATGIPRLSGGISAALPAALIMNWKFTRCVPQEAE